MKPFRTLTLLLAAVHAAPDACSSESPAVAAALALPRTEPRHYVDAALALIDLGAQAEAESIAGEMVALDTSPDALADLVDAVGTAPLSRLRTVLPTTADFVGRALAAADARANSPERLAELVKRLGGDRAAAIEAIRGLRQTGPAGVAYCLDGIADSDDPTLRARLREALVAMDPISLPALFEATGAENANVRTEAAYALGRLAQLNRLRSGLASALVAKEALVGPPGEPAAEAARWALARLTGTTLGVATAQTRLDAAVDDLLAGQVLFSEEADRGPTAGPSDLAMRLAGRLARESYQLNPAAPGAARRAAVLALESGADFDPDAWPIDPSEVLGEALNRGLHRAAERACGLVGERGDLGAVTAAAPQAAPIVKALDAPHPAVRAAAAAAVVAIQPQQAYAGSSRLITTLDYLAAARGDERAVVGSPQLARAGEFAGWLLGAGYAAAPTNSGGDLVNLATASADTRLVLVDVGVSLPGAREVVFRLRRTPATALTPIAILAPTGRLGEAEAIAADHGGEAGRVIAAPRPVSADTASTLAERLAGLGPASWPDRDARLESAASARKWLAELAESGPGFYALDRRFLTAGVAGATADP